MFLSIDISLFVVSQRQIVWDIHTGDLGWGELAFVLDHSSQEESNV
jgi:hypothetical protein